MTYKNPLDWPFAQKPRTPPSDKQTARFSSRGRPVTVAEACRRLADQLDKYTRSGREWRVDPDEVRLTSNAKTYKSGSGIYSSAREPDDNGVAVYFSLDGHAICLASDLFDRLADNIAAIAGHIEADRRQERYQVGSVAQRFHGFDALPPAGSSTSRSWDVVLRVRPDADHATVMRAYRTLSKELHPDVGGTREAWDELQAATDSYRASRTQ